MSSCGRLAFARFCRLFFCFLNTRTAFHWQSFTNVFYTTESTKTTLCRPNYALLYTLHDFMFDLVSATVAVITARCAVKVIDKEGAAVSHLNVGSEGATV